MPRTGLKAKATRPSATFTMKIGRNHFWSLASRFMSFASPSASSSGPLTGLPASGMPVPARTRTRSLRRLRSSIPPVTP